MHHDFFTSTIIRKSRRRHYANRVGLFLFLGWAALNWMLLFTLQQAYLPVWTWLNLPFSLIVPVQDGEALAALLMAATLAYIKSRELLPPDPSLMVDEEGEEAAAPRESLEPQDEEGYGYDIQFLMYGQSMDVAQVRADMEAMGWSVLVGGVTLSLLILPIVIISAREAIRSVPNEMREASYGMGATKWQTVRRVVLPWGVSKRMEELAKHVLAPGGIRIFDVVAEEIANEGLDLASDGRLQQAGDDAREELDRDVGK